MEMNQSGLKYSVIKSESQYDEYCDALEALVLADHQEVEDEIELLTLLIEKWDEEHNTFQELDPVVLIKSLMNDHGLKTQDLAKLLDVSQDELSNMLNYQKGLSQQTVHKLANHFKLLPTAFNRPYELRHEINRQMENARLMNMPQPVDNLPLPHSRTTAKPIA